MTANSTRYVPHAERDTRRLTRETVMKASPQVGVMSMAGGGLFVDVGLMLVEGRVAERGSARGHREGPHCPPQPSLSHTCSDNAFLCARAALLRRHMSLLSENSVPMCIDVLVCPDCPCGRARAAATNICSVPSPTDLLLEQWTVSVVPTKGICKGGGGGSSLEVDGKGLVQAIRSQLYFSQLSSWYSLGGVGPVCYRLYHPGTAPHSSFARPPSVHHFPLAPAPRGGYVKVSVKSLPRMDGVSSVSCPVHSSPSPLAATVTVFKSVFAELGHCLLDPPSRVPPPVKHGAGGWRDNRTPSPPARPVRSSPRLSRPPHIPRGVVDDRLQSGCQHIGKHHCQDDTTESHASETQAHHSGGEKSCPGSGPSMKCYMDGSFMGPGLAGSILNVFRSEVSWRREAGGGEESGRKNPLKRKRQELNQSSKKLLSDSRNTDLVESFNSLNIGDTSKPQVTCKSGLSRPVPGLFRRPQLILNSLCSSPPLPRSSVELIRTDSSSEDTECESPVAVVPKAALPRVSSPPLKPLFRPNGPLLGSLEESLLRGRVLPTSIVETGYTADLGASGAFCPRHLKLPVTVSFFPVIGLSAPYMGVVKLRKKGYHVPRSGTIQATLLNPLGTVIKMFVVPYDLSDMPPNCHTFLRQRTVALPASHLRYLIHLRFSSSKSGRVFVHTDIRMIIARQYDLDASLEPDMEAGAQLSSEVVAPSSPKYSTRK